MMNGLHVDWPIAGHLAHQDRFRHGRLILQCRARSLCAWLELQKVTLQHARLHSPRLAGACGEQPIHPPAGACQPEVQLYARARLLDTPLILLHAKPHPAPSSPSPHLLALRASSPTSPLTQQRVVLSFRMLRTKSVSSRSLQRPSRRT